MTILRSSVMWEQQLWRRGVRREWEVRNGTSEGSWTIKRKEEKTRKPEWSMGSCRRTATVSTAREAGIIVVASSLKGVVIPPLWQRPPSAGSGRWPGSGGGTNWGALASSGDRWCIICNKTHVRKRKGSLLCPELVMPFGANQALAVFIWTMRWLGWMFFKY